MSKKKRRRSRPSSRPARPVRPPASGGVSRSRASGAAARTNGAVAHPRARGAVTGAPDSAPVVGLRGSPGVAPEEVVGLVAIGELDRQLPALQAAISRRWVELRRDATHQAAAQLRVGDRVRIVHGVRPQYLQGATGTVTGWSGQSAVVQLDMPVGRYRTGEVRCPPLGLLPVPVENR